MMRLLVLWWLLSGWAWAQGPVYIQFEVWPEDSRVYLLSSTRGEGFPAGKPMPLDPTYVSRLQADALRFEVRCRGCQTRSIQVPSELLSEPIYREGMPPNTYRFPDTGRLSLEPEGLWRVYYPLRSNLLLVGLSGMTLLGLAALAIKHSRRNRELERERQHREAESAAAATSGDPLIEKQARFGGYQIQGRLGAGGMATVYRARSVESGQAVAIKVMQADLAEDEEFQRRFRREYQVMSNLQHPQLVTLLDGGDQEGRLYLVMELVEGTTLDKQIPTGGLAADEAASWLRQLMTALSHAHARQVVHRDLKPQNVMVTPAGQLKVMDFGLARRDDLSKVTVTGAFVGTPLYMAPEQVSAPPDARSDQYSFGIMAYQILTGTVPFYAEDPVALLMLHASAPPPPPRQHRSDLSLSLERWLLKMLAKDPEQRFADMPTVAQAFEEALADPETGEAWVVTVAARTRAQTSAAVEPAPLPEDWTDAPTQV